MTKKTFADEFVELCAKYKVTLTIHPSPEDEPRRIDCTIVEPSEEKETPNA